MLENGDKRLQISGCHLENNKKKRLEEINLKQQWTIS